MRNCLVVANQTLGGPELREEIRKRIEEGPCRFYVLVPRTHPVDYARQRALPFGWDSAFGWDSGRAAMTEPSGGIGAELDAETQARYRMEQVVNDITAMGAEASGELGDPDPFDAIEDVLRHREFDEVIVSTLPVHLSRWVRMDLSHRVKRHFDLPVTVVTAEQ